MEEAPLVLVLVLVLDMDLQVLDVGHVGREYRGDRARAEGQEVTDGEVALDDCRGQGQGIVSSVQRILGMVPSGEGESDHVLVDAQRG